MHSLICNTGTKDHMNYFLYFQGKTNAWYPIKKLTCVQTLCQVAIFNIHPTFKILLMNLKAHKLLRSYLTLPVTTSTAKRNFLYYKGSRLT